MTTVKKNLFLKITLRQNDSKDILKCATYIFEKFAFPFEKIVFSFCFPN